jgi:hypothetical protein
MKESIEQQNTEMRSLVTNTLKLDDTSDEKILEEILRRINTIETSNKYGI